MHALQLLVYDNDFYYVIINILYLALAIYTNLLRSNYLQWEAPNKGLNFVCQMLLIRNSPHFYPYLNRFMYSSAACSHHMNLSPKK